MTKGNKTHNIKSVFPQDACSKKNSSRHGNIYLLRCQDGKIDSVGVHGGLSARFITSGPENEERTLGQSHPHKLHSVKS